MPKKVIEKVPTGSERNEWLLEHLSAVDAGEDIPYFKTKDGDFLYFEKGQVNKKTGQIYYGLVSLTKKKARNARSIAFRQNRMPSIELYEKIFGLEKGGEIFAQEQKKLNLKYKNPDPSKFDIDHLGSKKELYPELARNLNPQLSEFNRQEGVRKLTPTQENALRIVPNDLETSIQLQGPELTQYQTDQVMGRIEGGKTGDFDFNKGGVRLNRNLSKFGKGVSKILPGSLDDAIIGGVLATGAAGATLLTGGSPAQAGEAFLETGVDVATGDLQGGNLADSTLQPNLDKVKNILYQEPINIAAPTGVTTFDAVAQPLIKGLAGQPMGLKRNKASVIFGF